jgi:hypothetical protein
MTIYARIEDGRVAELFDTDEDIHELFHPALRWVECGPLVSVGWTYDGVNFSEPPLQPAVEQPPTVIPPLDKLKAWLAANPDVVAALDREGGNA